MAMSPLSKTPLLAARRLFRQEERMPSRKQEAEARQAAGGEPAARLALAGGISRAEERWSKRPRVAPGKPFKPRFAYGPDSLFERCVYEGRAYPIGGDK
jgi:hypothetical protein